MPNAKPVSALVPHLAHVRQRWIDDGIDDIEGAVTRALTEAEFSRRVAPGARVAITVGSRGIDRIAQVVRAMADALRERGAAPFVVAAMGSHGGATAAGQREVLAGYGITEAAVDCDVRCTMEVVELGRTRAGNTVFFDREAFNADAVVVVGRVKPHSILTGDLGSGLLKMTAVGLGNQRGADALHALGLQAHLAETAALVLAHAPIAMGLALVENTFDRIALVRAVVPQDFATADRELLALARRYLPTLPFDPLDVLIVDRIGKDISGAGMDPNVIGMWRRNGGTAERTIRRIVALDLSDASHGNAIGIGMADIVTARLADKMDVDVSLANAMTSDFFAGLKVPVTMPTANDAVALACRTFAPQHARVMRIADTAHLENLWISEALLAEAASDPQIEIVCEPRPMDFARSA